MKLQEKIAARAQFQGESEHECIYCGNEIPQQRRALGNVKLCIDCQTAVESDSKHFR
ncbi:TraR/DksA C4-type zinc finger protein [Acinetobacter bereziniae]